MPRPYDFYLQFYVDRNGRTIIDALVLQHVKRAFANDDNVVQNVVRPVRRP